MTRDRIATAAFGAAFAVLPALGGLFIAGVLYLGGATTRQVFMQVLAFISIVAAAGVLAAGMWLGIRLFLDRRS
jgi:hypothetical protein